MLEIVFFIAFGLFRLPLDYQSRNFRASADFSYEFYNMQLVPTRCPKCEAPLPVPYIRLGMTEWCNTCLYPTVPVKVIGSAIPQSGYSLTFIDFRVLIDDANDSASFEPLLAEWFGYTVNGEGKGEGRNNALILNAANEAIDPVWLHLRIQEDETKRGQLYNLAMTLWR